MSFEVPLLRRGNMWYARTAIALLQNFERKTRMQLLRIQTAECDIRRRLVLVSTFFEFCESTLATSEQCEDVETINKSCLTRLTSIF